MPGFPLIRTVAHCFRTISSVVVDLVRLAFLAAHSRRALAAENLFLRKQLALFQERKVKPRRANDSTRWVMATLSRMFPWRGALVNVQADTLIRWHRKGFPAVLALEIEADRKTWFAKEPAAIDPADGGRECDLGRGTHRQRICN
jgi:hypothetical protein